MEVTQRLHELGQSLSLDNVTHRLLTDGTLRGYIRELLVTGLTSNPTILGCRASRPSRTEQLQGVIMLFSGAVVSAAATALAIREV